MICIAFSLSFRPPSHSRTVCRKGCPTQDAPWKVESNRVLRLLPRPNPPNPGFRNYARATPPSPDLRLLIRRSLVRAHVEEPEIFLRKQALRSMAWALFSWRAVGIECVRSVSNVPSASWPETSCGAHNRADRKGGSRRSSDLQLMRSSRVACFDVRVTVE